MDARLVLTFVLELDLPCVASGGPIFAGLSEISHLRQAKTKNSDKNWIFLIILKVIFIFAHWIYILKLVLKKGIRLRISNPLMNYCSFSRHFAYLLVVCASLIKLHMYILRYLLLHIVKCKFYNLHM